MLNICLIFCSSMVLKAHSQADDWWWYDMGNTWETSSYLASYNPYYTMYRQSAAQMDWYGYAQHVGKINRGQYFNPELNMPRHRAFGYQADFNPQDLKSGAFNYKPQGQKFRAAAVHVNLGLANHVGEVRTMPMGQHVQADGTVLVQTSPRQRSPCHPDPCKHLTFFTCTTVNDVTAKCSDSGKVQLILTGFDLSDNDDRNANYFDVLPDFHNGSACIRTESDCGVVYDGVWLNAHNALDDFDDNDSDPSVLRISLTKLADGSNYRDYTYAVVAAVFPDNPSTSRTKLRVILDGKDRQVLAVPQWDGTTNVNYDGRFLYFFGCFRPQNGLVDTRGAGFFPSRDSVVFAGLEFEDDGLCKALQGWTDGPGFNPYVQGGSGTPVTPGWPPGFGGK